MATYSRTYSLLPLICSLWAVVLAVGTACLIVSYAGTAASIEEVAVASETIARRTFALLVGGSLLAALYGVWKVK